MGQIDWTLLLLVAVIVVAVIGLIIALQTAGGRKRLADAGLRLAEALIAMAVKWLEQNLPGGPDVPTIAFDSDIERARQALGWLRGG